MQQKEGVERRERGAGIAQPLHAGLEDEGERAEGFGVGEAVVGGIGLDEVLEAAGGLPVELARVDDQAAEGGAVAADELGGGVDDDVGAPLDGPHQGRGGRGVVDDQREAIFVGDGGELLDVGHVELGIAQRLGVERAGFGVDGGAQAGEVVGIDEAHGDALLGQRVVEEVVGASVERCGGDDLVAGAGQGLDGERLGGLAGCDGERGRSALQRSDALLQHVGGGVHQAGVDVAELLEAEEARRVVGIVEDVGGGLVDGHGARVGCGVHHLTGVNCKRGKMLLGCCGLL